MKSFGACPALSIQLFSSVALALILPAAAFGDELLRKSDSSFDVQASRPRQRALYEGDKLKLVFYERLESEEDKWRGRTGSVPRGFHQRAELSGDYVVAEDGTISLPMLGRFQAAGLTQDAFVEALSKPFETLIERRGFVNVVEIERRPVYVVGPVKTPGSFKFEPGMTVLHVLALSGGVREREAETWQRVEFGREVDRLQRTLDRAKRLIARTEVLQSERDGTRVPQGEIASLVGKAQAASLVNEEAWQRNLTTMSRQAQEAALKTALSNATSELASRSERLAPMDATIAMRAERARNITGLADKNIIGRPVVMQAQSELGDAQDRRNQANMEMESARKRVADAERDLVRFRLENGLEVGRATVTAKREAADTLEEGQGLLDVVRALATDRNNPGQDGIEYEIVRRVGGQTTVLPANPTDAIEPGDLVRLRIATPAASRPELELSSGRPNPDVLPPAPVRRGTDAVDAGSSGSVTSSSVGAASRNGLLRMPATARPFVVRPISKDSTAVTPLGSPRPPQAQALAVNAPVRDLTP